MKQILQSKTGTVILACVGGLVVAVLLWRYLGLGDWVEVRGAIRDIAKGDQVAKARTLLETLDSRAYVLEKLEEAVEDDDWGVRAKYNLLTTLNMLSAPKVVRRALHSRSLTAQRAACWQLYGDPEAKPRCAEILIAWLKEEGADGRSMAALLCKQLDLAEAQPVLLEIVGRDPRTDGESDLFKRAIDALKDPKPKELVDRLLAMARDATLDEEVRGIAIESLQRMKEGPRDQVLALSIDVLNDTTPANRMLRLKTAAGLRDFPEDRAWQALEAVLLSEQEQDSILQRNCLFALGQMEPKDKELARKYLDRLKQLLHDRRVYHNKYFAIRVDVATALAALNAREPITLDIMCDYLADEDKDDKEHLVRQEAWLTLWTLTGTKFADVPEPEIWEIPPQPFPDPQAAREFFFRRAQHRPGITSAQAAMVAKIGKDLARMQKARQTYQGLKGKILEQWRVEAEKADEKKAEEEKKAANAVPPGPGGPQGPQRNPAPPKEEEKGRGEEEEEEAPPKDEGAEAPPEGQDPEEQKPPAEESGGSDEDSQSRAIDDDVERLFAMAADDKLGEDVRGTALVSLLDGREPRDRVVSLAVGILADPEENRILRMKAALGLRNFPEDRAWQALEEVLLSEVEQDSILQRNCLYALGQMEPKDPALAGKYLDRLRQLLHDRRVYHHRYFAMRVDVATALAALDACEPITLDIMCDYLVDEDKDDKQHLVRQEGWLTLWALTGTKFADVPEPEIWEIPPQPFPDPQTAREFIFRRAQHRPGITPEQAAMVAKIADDTVRMQKARQTYMELRGKILERWRVEAEKAAEKEAATNQPPPPGGK